MRALSGLAMMLAMSSAPLSGFAQTPFDLRARTSDERMTFLARSADIRAAYGSFCATNSHCDRFENYDVEVAIAAGRAGFAFYHKDIGRRPVTDIDFVAAFTCGYVDVDLSPLCEAGHH